MITYADKSRLSEIRKLWDIAFGEDAAFNDFFFENIFERALVYLKNNKIIAMTQTIPYEIAEVGKSTYIYGATTHPKYRGLGIMGELLERSFELDRQNGFAGSFLIPANEGLFDFYAKFGYQKAFYIQKNTYAADDGEIEDVTDVGFLNEVYENSLSALPHPVRSRGYWLKQIQMFRALGGYAVRNKTAYAFGWNDQIQELMGENKAALAAAVAKKFGLPEMTAATSGGNTPLGMAKLYSGETPRMYFNLMYD